MRVRCPREGGCNQPVFEERKKKVTSQAHGEFGGISMTISFFYLYLIILIMCLHQVSWLALLRTKRKHTVMFLKVGFTLNCHTSL